MTKQTAENLIKFKRLFTMERYYEVRFAVFLRV